MVGAIGEALVGPLSPTAGPRDEERTVAGLVQFCIRSVTNEEPAHVRAA